MKFSYTFSHGKDTVCKIYVNFVVCRSGNFDPRTPIQRRRPCSRSHSRRPNPRRSKIYYWSKLKTLISFWSVIAIKYFKSWCWWSVGFWNHVFLDLVFSQSTTVVKRKTKGDVSCPVVILCRSSFRTWGGGVWSVVRPWTLTTRVSPGVRRRRSDLSLPLFYIPWKGTSGPRSWQRLFRDTLERD